MKRGWEGVELQQVGEDNEHPGCCKIHVCCRSTSIKDQKTRAVAAITHGKTPPGLCAA